MPARAGTVQQYTQAVEGDAIREHLPLSAGAEGDTPSGGLQQEHQPLDGQAVIGPATQQEGQRDAEEPTEG